MSAIATPKHEGWRMDERFDLWPGRILEARARVSLSGVTAEHALQAAQLALQDSHYHPAKLQLEPALRQRGSVWHTLDMRRGNDTLAWFLQETELPLALIPGVREKAQVHIVTIAARDTGPNACELLFHSRLDSGSANIHLYSIRALSAVVRGLESRGATVTQMTALERRDVERSAPIHAAARIELEAESRKIRRAARRARRR